MLSMKFYKILAKTLTWIGQHKGFVFTLICLLIACNIWYKRFLSAYEQCKTWKQKNAQLVQEIAAIQTQLSKKQHFIKKFIREPEFREIVVRKKLCLIKKQEYMIRFYTPETMAEGHIVTF